MIEQRTVESDALEALVGQVAGEFSQRLSQGEQPDIEEYAQRHPEIASVLRQVLPALQVLGEASPETDPSGNPVPCPSPASGLLGDFRIIRQIGRGGMGVVYEAEQVSLRRRVALKTLPLASAMDANRLRRFQNEAQAAACLHHTNIVPVFAVGCERNVHYYAMQFIEGATLAAIIEQMARQHAEGGGQKAEVRSQKSVTCTPTPEEQAKVDGHVTEAYPVPGQDPVLSTQYSVLGTQPTAPIARLSTQTSLRSREFFQTVARLGIQAAEALDYAHQQGIIHRDIKPANLLIDTRSNLWITDFGLAHFHGEPGLTLTGDVLGTLRYMSPEQALAKRMLVDHRTDIYSLGVTLYELLTLQPAYPGSDRQEVLRQIAFDDPRPLRTVHRAVPAELETIIGKAIEKGPADRYATAQDLADDFDGSTSPGLQQTVNVSGNESSDQIFVTHLYNDLLLRAPDAAGLAGWSTALDQSRLTRSQVSVAFEISLEYRTNIVTRLYATLLQRTPDPQGLAAAVNFLTLGGTSEQLEVTILGSPEYFARRGNGTNAGFLTALYQDALHRALDGNGAATWERALAMGISTADVARAVLSSNESATNIVQALYSQLLHRSADPSGLGAFRDALLHGLSEELAIVTLATSDEYFGRSP